VAVVADEVLRVVAPPAPRGALVDAVLVEVVVAFDPVGVGDVRVARARPVRVVASVVEEKPHGLHVRGPLRHGEAAVDVVAAAVDEHAEAELRAALRDRLGDVPIVAALVVEDADAEHAAALREAQALVEIVALSEVEEHSDAQRAGSLASDLRETVARDGRPPAGRVGIGALVHALHRLHVRVRVLAAEIDRDRDRVRRRLRAADRDLVTVVAARVDDEEELAGDLRVGLEVRVVAGPADDDAAEWRVVIERVIAKERSRLEPASLDGLRDDDRRACELVVAEASEEEVSVARARQVDLLGGRDHLAHLDEHAHRSTEPSTEIGAFGDGLLPQVGRRADGDEDGRERVAQRLREILGVRGDGVARRAGECRHGVLERRRRRKAR
jgi:hypothetical protein